MTHGVGKHLIRAGTVWVLLAAMLVEAPAAASEASASSELRQQVEPVVDESPREKSHRILEEVMAGEAFHQKSTLKVPLFMRDLFDTELEQQTEKQDLSWLSKLMEYLASILEVLLWLALISLIIWLTYRFRLWEFSKKRPLTRKRERPAVLMGMDVTLEAQPEDALVTAVQAWQGGESRKAVGLLYRGALIRLMDDYDCQFSEGDTEGQCIAEARTRAAPAVVEYFADLTRCWQCLAYGHQSLGSTDFDSLVTGWDRVWVDENE